MEDTAMSTELLRDLLKDIMARDLLSLDMVTAQVSVITQKSPGSSGIWLWRLPQEICGAWIWLLLWHKLLSQKSPGSSRIWLRRLSQEICCAWLWLSPWTWTLLCSPGP